MKISGRLRWLLILFLVVAFITSGLLIFFLLNASRTVHEENFVEDVPMDEEVVETEEEEVKEPEVAKVDFQPIVEEWANSAGGNRSVLIYDLDRNEVVGEYNVDESYNTASLYKLFVVYEGYRRVNSGEWNGSEAAGSTGHTILECLDLAIRESHSPCAETLWSKIGRSELDGIIKNDFGIINSDISHLVSNSKDILAIMQKFYQHAEITDQNLIDKMKDSFLNQPVTTYDWRQGLPSGFSRANVYNKVGWDYNPDGRYWNIYHDTAIVEFPEENRHFIVVVMTNRVDFKKIKELGAKLENKFYTE